MRERKLEDELEPWLVLNDSQPPELFCFLSFSLYLNFKTFLNPVFLLRLREKNGPSPPMQSSPPPDGAALLPVKASAVAGPLECGCGVFLSLSLGGRAVHRFL